jgi:hypothetical protein
MTSDRPGRHVVSVSSGVGSAYLWSLVLAEHSDAVGVFADVNGEDEDNYRFLDEIHSALGGELVRLNNDGRTIWDVFRKTRFLGNSRVDTCSRELKREPIERWLRENCDPSSTVMHIAVDWTEDHRIPAIRNGWASLGWQTAFWMADRSLDKFHALAWLNTLGIEPPSLTRDGWPHANCGGGCVRAGHGQFAALLVRRPSAFAEWERQETEFREWIGKDVSILRDRRGGGSIPMPLTELRRRVVLGEIKPDLGDGSCNCMQPTALPQGSLFDDATGGSS